MLFVSSSRRVALVLPLALLSAGGIVFAGGLAAFVHGERKPAALLALFGGGMFLIGLSELSMIRVEGSTLSVRTPFRRSELHGHDFQLGVRLKSGTRTSSFVVFVTDARASLDLAEYSTERGARRGVSQLTSGLLSGRVPSESNRARMNVQSVEKEWQSSVASAQKVIDDYYRSPAWRRAKYIVVIVVVTWLLATAFYAYFSGKAL